MSGEVSGNNLRQLISEKELEVSRLREETLSTLEIKLRERESQLEEAQEKLKELESDFRYNLDLLEQRDRELNEYDRAFGAFSARLEDKDKEVAELTKNLNQALSDLKIEHGKSRELEASFQQKRVELETALQDERLVKEETLLCQKEEFEAQKRQLQRALKEADDEIERQRRDLSGGFSVEMHRLQLEFQQRAEEAVQKATVAESLSHQRLQEMKICKERERKQAEIAEAALQKAESKEHQLETVTWELENMKKLKNDQMEELHSRCETLTKQKQDIENSNAKVAQELVEAKKKLEECVDQHKRDMQEIENGRRTALVDLKRQLEESKGRIGQLAAEKEEHLAEIAARRAELQAEVSKVKEQHEKEVLALVQQFERRAAQRTSQIRELEEGVWLRDAEIRALREKMATAKATLSERHRDVEVYKGQLVDAGDQHRELHRKLVEMELHLDVRLEAKESDIRTEMEDTIKKITGQRDVANAAMQEAETRVSQKDAELASMQEKLTHTSTELENLRVKYDELVQQNKEQKASHDISISLPSSIQSPRLSEISGDTSRCGPCSRTATNDHGPLHTGDQDGSKLPGAPEVAALRLENERLRTVISEMRSDIENMDQKGGAGTNEAVLIEPLVSEMKASDEDLAQALEHVELLQAELQGGGLATEKGELIYMRSKIKELRIENRRLRRSLMDANMRGLISKRTGKEVGGLEDSAKENRIPGEVPLPNMQIVPTDCCPNNSDINVEEVKALEVEVAQLKEQIAALETVEDNTPESCAGCRDLAEARETVQELTAENEKLMELSNALRAERDRAMLANNSLNHTDTSHGAAVITPRPPFPIQVQSNATHPWLQLPYPIHQCTKTLAYPLPQRDWPESRPNTAPHHYNHTCTGPSQDDHQDEEDQMPSDRRSRRVKLNSRQLQLNDSPRQSSPSEKSPTGEREPPVTRLRNVPRSENNEDHGARGVDQLKGSKMGKAERDCSVPKSVSERYTVSQRAKLKALQRRKEQKSVQRKVRNYNVQDDEVFRSSNN